MDGKGWKAEYGISPEGVTLLGYLEALPQDERAGIVEAVAQFCKAQGYMTLFDDLRTRLEAEAPQRPPVLAKVLQFRR